MRAGYIPNVVTIFIGATIGVVGAAVNAEEGLAPLSEGDRTFIEEHLGSDFLGEPVDPPPIGNAEKFLGIVDGARWEFQRVSGDQPRTLTFGFVDGSTEMLLERVAKSI